MIRIPCFPEDLFMPVIYAIEPNHVLRTVRLSRLMPTQSDLLPAILDHYRQRRRMTDADNALPYGICFAGSDTVYITNGHHRWYVCREQGRQRMRMRIHFHPLTLREALLACCYPPLAAAVAVKKPKPVAVPVGGYRQLQLGLA